MPASSARTGRAVELAKVTVTFGSRTALDRVSIDVAPGEMFTLVGPSGSGKSTLLRVIAGLERPKSGCVSIGGDVVADPARFVEANDRRVGMVFQDYALFPHLTVAQNVGYGLRRLARDVVRSRVDDCLERVGLADRAGSYPHTLSGGERQRVALARALAPAPDVVLLDEPFCSLDVSLRRQIRAQTFGVLRDVGATAVLVTHDPDDAREAGGRVARMHDGTLTLDHATHSQFGAEHVVTA